MNSLTVFDIDSGITATSIDIGTVGAGSSDDTILRIYNTSDAATAEDVTLSLDGDQQEQLYLSLDGDIFGTSIDLGDIPPSGFSPVFTLRRVTASVTVDGPCAADLVITPVGWSTTADQSISTNIALDETDD
jgi:hypothetical protein